MGERSDKATLKIKAQVLLGSAIAIGPGKADLLEAVARTGSIAAAGRSLGLSYRRTRDMIDTLNACWRVPLVETVRGGSSGGGATLSEAGVAVLDLYRKLDAALRSTAEKHGAALVGLVGQTPAHPGETG